MGPRVRKHLTQLIENYIEQKTTQEKETIKYFEEINRSDKLK